MGIRFTPKTREILNYITQYKFITTKQCADIFYPNNKQPLIQSQVKLRNLFNEGLIKRYENNYSKEYIYACDNKNISEHQLYLMNLYAYLYKNFKVLYFRTEASWKLSKKRSDAHIVFQKDDGSTIGLLCEIDLFHQTGQDKLDQLYRSGEVQEFYKNEFGVENYYPSVVIVNANGKTSIKSDSYDIVCCDFDFNGLVELL